MNRALLLILLLLSLNASAAIRYVDSAVSSSGNGQSWATAWKTLEDITGVSGGDIVYLQGTFTGHPTWHQWLIQGSGNNTNPIIYRVGQDVGHNSAVHINLSGSPGIVPSSGDTFRGIYIDGNYNDQRNLYLSGAFGGSGSHHADGFRLSYITFTNVPGNSGFISMNKFRFDHCYIPAQMDMNVFFYLSSSANGTDYYSNEIDHNIHYIGHGTGGNGDDGWQWISHTRFHHNTLIGVDLGGGDPEWRNHQDFIQSNGPYLMFDHNLMIGTCQYFILIENSTAHFRGFNNVYVAQSGTGWATAFGYAIGSTTNSGGTSDVIIANDTFDFEAATGAAISVGNSVGQPASAILVNNILYDSSINSYPNGGTISASNNYNGTSVSFVSRGGYGVGDYHLTSPNANVIDQGISPSWLTSIFTDDADGNTRTGTWDIGAYEYASGGGDVTAPTLNTATIGSSGTTITLAFDESVSVGSGGSGGWALTMSGGSAITLTYSSGSGSSSLVYSLSRTVNSGETVSSGLNYTQPGDGIEDSAGNDLANVSSHAVTNNSTQGGAVASGVWNIGNFKGQ